MTLEAIWVKERATKTLLQEECVQTLTAKGLLRLSQIKTLYTDPSLSLALSKDSRLLFQPH